MDRTIYYTQAQLRGFDLEAGPKDAFMGQATALDATLGGVFDRVGVFSGCGVTVNGLNVSVAAGYVLSYGPADATAQGSIAADTTTVLHQAAVTASTLTIPAPSPSAGQSAIVTIYSTLSQTDSVREGDPTSGLLGFWNTADPSHMLQGPNNTGTTLPTVRRSIGEINYSQGAAAATGSQVAPSLPAGSVPIAYIQWDNGDTSFTQSKVTQPNLMAGLLHAHHNGTPGQAPKVLLTNGAEVQGLLPGTMIAFPILYGPSLAYSFALQNNGDANSTYTDANGTHQIIDWNATSVNAYQPLNVYSNINGKFDYVGNGAIGIGGSLSVNGPANNNFQWNGNDTEGFNPIYSHTNGIFAAVGGIYAYSTSAACAYLGSSITGPIVNFYGTGGVIGAILNNGSGGVTFSPTSDERVKEQVAHITPDEALARIRKVQPKSFVRKDANKPQRVTGFIAHEYAQAYKWAVHGNRGAVRFDKEGKEQAVLQYIDPIAPVPDIIVALIAAHDMIEELKKQVAELLSRTQPS